MIYLLFTFLAVLATATVWTVSARKGVLKLGKLPIYKPCEEECQPWQGKSVILLTMICFAAFFAAQISLYKNTSVINFVKLFGVLILTVCAAAVDLKRRIIPNVLIIAGLIFRAGLYVYEIFFGQVDLKSIAINDLIGFAIGFVFLALVSVVSRGALGFGDAKLFGVIGLTTGSFCTYSTLFISLVISVVVSIVNIIRKKMGRKDAFPFGPCIAAGYLIAILLTSY